MKGFILPAVLLALLTAPAPVAEEQPKKSMKLFEKHHYDEAATLLRPSLLSLGQDKEDVALLTMGTSYLRNAELHRELYQTALVVTAEYYRKLAAETGKGRSRFVDLYLGEFLLDSGKPDAAVAPLEKFKADDSIPQKFRDIAAVLLGTSAFLKDDKQKAEELWKGVDPSDPEVGTELAAAYGRAGLSERNPLELCENALVTANKTGKQLPQRVIKNVLEVYADNGLTEKGLDLLRSADLRAPSYGEHIAKSKDVNFYSISLIKSLSGLYLQASRAYLEKASRGSKVRDIATFHMAEAHALSGNVEQSSKALTSFLTSTLVPPQYRDRAAVRQAANQYQRGKRTEAIGAWDDISRKQPADPDLLGEVLQACGRLRIDCPTAAKKADSVVESGQGKKFSFLNASLGTYYLGKRNYAKALAYLEAGRDKGNKNKIEANEPALLVELAELYYRSKKYSEALEIFFEMSKYFPVVRQIQEPMQGIYSKEQKSAGDVKIN